MSPDLSTSFLNILKQSGYEESFLERLRNTNVTNSPLPDNESIGYLGNYIDHTLLSPSTTAKQIEKLCQEAIDNKFKAVCVNPAQLETANQYLKKQSSSSHKVDIATVIGFPLGQNLTQTKIEETRQCIQIGVQEIDVVINIGRLVEGDYKYVIDELSSLATIARSENVLVKVIIESGLLRRDFSEIKIEEACICCIIADVDYVKTSTGFLGTGATVEDVSLMYSCVSPYGLKVKASGGVGNASDAKKMISIGASRIGASKGVSIVNDKEHESNITSSY